MKITKILAAAAVAVAAVACSSNTIALGEWGGVNADAQKQIDSLKKALLPSEAQVDTVSYLLGINFGSMIKGYDFGGEELNYALVKKGIDDFIKAQGDQMSEEFGEQFEINPNDNWQVMDEYLQSRRDYKAAANVVFEKAYLEAMEGNGYSKTESGLLYRIDTLGSVVKVEVGDTIKVAYKGTTPAGATFDECDVDGAREFTLEEGGLIEGWLEALPLIGEGGTISIVIPSAAAYGASGAMQAGIEANMPILFTITVVKDTKPVPAAEEETPEE